MVKMCYACKEVKPLTDFHKNSKRSDGLSSACKSCRNAYSREYKKKNRDKVLAQRAIYRKNNKEKINEYNRKYVRKEFTKEYRNQWFRDKRSNDNIFYTRTRATKLISSAFEKKGYSRNTKSRKILGCSYKKLKEQLESQFKDGMSWQNKSQWHIDHIIPLASANSVEEVLMLNHHSNLQPLWADENVKKGDKYNPLEKEEYIKWYRENIGSVDVDVFKKELDPNQKKIDF